RIINQQIYDRYFFFSSRRRHTRSLRDWSSDVCSSDLDSDVHPWLFEARRGSAGDDIGVWLKLEVDLRFGGPLHRKFRELGQGRQIGRASCRERGWKTEGRRSDNIKNTEFNNELRARDE